MAENRDFGSQEEAKYWPPIDENSTPRYQAPNFFKNFAANSQPWNEPSSIPVYILKQAEERVTAQKKFFKFLFIYLGIITAAWFVGIPLFIAHYDNSDRMMAIYIPLFLTLVGGVRVAYSYFNAFIWAKKSYQQRVMEEAQKLMF